MRETGGSMRFMEATREQRNTTAYGRSGMEPATAKQMAHALAYEWLQRTRQIERGWKVGKSPDELRAIVKELDAISEDHYILGYVDE